MSPKAFDINRNYKNKPSADIITHFEAVRNKTLDPVIFRQLKYNRERIMRDEIDDDLSSTCSYK